jgi:hypothetical protein
MYLWKSFVSGGYLGTYRLSDATWSRIAKLTEVHVSRVRVGVDVQQHRCVHIWLNRLRCSSLSLMILIPSFLLAI